MMRSAPVRPRLPVVPVLLAICLLPSSGLFAQADHLGLPESIRCDGSIIEAGDLQSKVLAKCGEPTDRIDRKEYRIVHSRYLRDPRRRYLLDRFVMDFTDPGLFASEQGMVGRYGHTHSHFMGPFEQDDTLLNYSGAGHTVHRVVMGAYPVGASRGLVSWDCRVVSADDISEWVYNLGPTRFVRVLTFRNGRLLRIEMMGYGY